MPASMRRSGGRPTLGGGRVGDGGLRIPEVGGDGEHPGGIDDPPRRFAPPRDIMPPKADCRRVASPCWGQGNRMIIIAETKP